MAAAASSPSFSSDLRHVVLNNGVNMPTVGFGSAFGNWTQKDAYQGFTTESAWPAFAHTITAGYRHWDNALIYGTQRHLGDTLAPLFASSKIKRQDIFITTKLAHPFSPMAESRTWNVREVMSGDYRRKLVGDLETCLEALGIGYVDLLLVHWPGEFNGKDIKFNQEFRKKVWQVFEEFYEKGRARAIGVSNFSAQHVEEILSYAKVKPQVNQLELHPYCQDPQLVDFCTKHGIVVEAYAPFASGEFGLLEDAVLTQIAQEVGRSVGQVVLRWHLQHHHVVLPKSSSEKRIKENLSLFDFQLSDKQMAAIDALQKPGAEQKRTCPSPYSIA